MVEPKYVRRSQAKWYIKIILFFVPKRFWITIYDTVYYSDYDNELNEAKGIYTNVDDHQDRKNHENVHFLQWQKYGIVLYPILYLFFPCPIFFAYFRWKFEREAYLINIMYDDYDTDAVVNLLWYKYLFTWPPCLMRKWFIANL